MTMDIDALVNKYNEASDDVASIAERHGLCPSGAEMGRAGIRAVVEALRDEIVPSYWKLTELSSVSAHDLRRFFNDILGDAGEKAAGGPQDDGILIGNQNVEAIINDLHDEQKNKAAGPSPDVCIWTIKNTVVFVAGCDGTIHKPALRGFCPSCGKPISFREK